MVATTFAASTLVGMVLVGMAGGLTPRRIAPRGLPSSCWPLRRRRSVVEVILVPGHALLHGEQKGDGIVDSARGRRNYYRKLAPPPPTQLTNATRRRRQRYHRPLGTQKRASSTWRFFLLGLPGTPGRWVVKSSFGARIRFFYHERKDFFLFFPTRLACDTAGNRTRVFRLSIHPN